MSCAAACQTVTSLPFEIYYADLFTLFLNGAQDYHCLSCHPSDFFNRAGVHPVPLLTNWRLILLERSEQGQEQTFDFPR